MWWREEILAKERSEATRQLRRAETKSESLHSEKIENFGNDILKISNNLEINRKYSLIYQLSKITFKYKPAVFGKSGIYKKIPSINV